MKTVEYESLDLKWPFEVPTTVEEYNGMGVGADCLRDAINHNIYHVTLGDVRGTFADVLQASVAAGYGDISPQFINRDSTKKEDDGDGFVQLNDGAFINKVLSKTGKAIADFKGLQDIVLKGGEIKYKDGEGKDQTLKVEAVKFDPTRKPRQAPKPKTPTKQALEAADTIIKDHAEKVEAIVATLQGLNKDAKIEHKKNEDGSTHRETIAFLIMANEARKRAQEKLASKYNDPAALV